ncbi:MAG: 4-(cytidine 5'-diphospho)-2-C-methyl-D-erythritol kinase [Zoogloeaceae bacterium]|jgi:4-diphosphocytidyl-2-C-methyl-D-erythritol kinase|nr:4-(cytidine 5'-diphospho)-2-C-methyl-D-erythritol kinase [Zoogloeaceae bacterium]
MQDEDVEARDWQSVWPAPAKINLFLHIVGRRADGYHLLQTLFRFLDYGDSLRFSPREDAQIILARPLPGVLPEHDLCARAARLLQRVSGCGRGAHIALEKRIPLGGGLGGGSSDAATTLLALNHLWQLHLPRHQLREMALQLGADVPAFILGCDAFAEGVGERLTPVDLSTACYLLVFPPVQVPTARIFAHPELRRDTPRMPFADWHPGEGHNDLEPVVCALYPDVANSLALLRQHAPNSRMSGSGGTLFAECPSQPAARALAEKLPLPTVIANAHGASLVKAVRCR